jgi:ceramide glucosyltransferase
VVACFSLGFFAFLSFLLMVWQYVVAIRFPLHSKSKRLSDSGTAPAVTLLKPVKGVDAETENSLRSWLSQDYPGPTQFLFATASQADPVCEIIRKLLVEFPNRDAQLIVADPSIGANAKISKLAQIEPRIKHAVVCISDADVRVPPDFLRCAIGEIVEGKALTPLSGLTAADPERDTSSGGSNTHTMPDPTKATHIDIAAGEGPAALRPETGKELPVGLVNCFYRLANPSTAAMHWEAVAINADFWSQVLQARSLKPLNFALGAVMLTGKKQLTEIGGFLSLKDCLADDYQLGNRIAKRGWRIAICPVVVDCFEEPMSWGAVWKHQLRWARTIRVSQPLPYFFSIVSNATFWPLVWMSACPNKFSLSWGAGFLLFRFLAAFSMQHRLGRSADVEARASEQRRSSSTFNGCRTFAAIPVKDLVQVGIWFRAFTGNTIEWAGHKMVLQKDGTMIAAG